MLNVSAGRAARVKLLFIAGLVSSISSLALASYETVLNWFASRPLSQQVDWQPQPVADPAALLKKAYVLGELSNRAYSSTVAGRNVAALGFRELLPFIDKSAELDGGDVGAVIGVGAGGAIDIITGGATGGLGALIGGKIGHSKIKHQKVTAAAFVADSVDGSMRVVSVRGSADLPDWVLDANASTVESDGVTYHHGFFLYAGLLYDDVRKKLGDACYDGTQVWLTGHSMGGAAAEILAYWLQRDGCNIAGVMTFGSPLPGRDDLQKAYNQVLGDVTHRFMHVNDPVACLPLGLDWAQVGHLHSISGHSMRLDDPRDLCTGGGDTVVGQAGALVLKLHEASEPSTEIALWMRTAAADVGLCPDTKAGRAFLGILTLGASTLTCKSIDLSADLAVLKDQLLRLHNVALNVSNPYAHSMDCSYIERFVIMGYDMGLFSEAIWAHRMEETWKIQDCSPPARRPEPTEYVRKPKPPGTQCCEWGLDDETCTRWPPENGACD